MSSPHVAGIAALYIGDNPAALPAEVTSVIKNNATAGVLTNIGSGSPNRLAYSIFPASSPTPVIQSVTAEYVSCPKINYPSYKIKFPADRPVIEYDVDFSTNGTSWTVFYNGPSSSKTLSGFSGGTKYYMRARARDSVGWGAFKQMSFVATKCNGGIY